ncbi:MAG: helicase-related protein [Nitrospirota bacterium]
MPRIFDNIEQKLLSALHDTLPLSNHADFCVGYFNLRGWKQLDSHVEDWSGSDGNCCRLLVGMQRLPQEELRTAIGFAKEEVGIDNQTALRLKKKLAEDFRDQLTFGVPNNEDEAGLRKLAAQIKAKKVVVKLFLRHPLHAKLYLLFRPDPNNPTTGFLGSSNLTFSGLSSQGELNVDVLDHDACAKLEKWFEDRWSDRWCVDISEELVRIIEESWAREDIIPPYHIYLKIAYHLSQEARAGLSEFKIPKEFGNKLFEFQSAAVKIAAHHIHKRDGVLIGDVVGLGKTLMATALAKIFEDDFDLETLIICPKNLVPMWEDDYKEKYRLRGKVLSLSQVNNELPNLRRYRLVVIDESHNLRNREGKRYKAILDYIEKNESKCILLSATPYNKTYIDLSNQLRLFVPDTKNLGIRPEKLLKETGILEFERKHQCLPHTIAAFEKSEYADDWRELMRLYLVRRTRGFIKENYAEPDPETGRRFLLLEDGTKSFFPDRIPKTIKFKIDDDDPEDQYAPLYSTEAVDAINSLDLPRYGLGNYIAPTPKSPPTQNEAKIIEDLSRGGRRLMGFCRTNLFKRLESSGFAFLQSVERHILRNYIFLHALETGSPIPIGTQDAGMLDPGSNDEDADTGDMFNGEDGNGGSAEISGSRLRTDADFRRRAEEVYKEYATLHKKQFKWLRHDLFIKSLSKHLKLDITALLNLLKKSGDWDPRKDNKLKELQEVLSKKHPGQKVLIFTQFADTVRYLEKHLKLRGVKDLSGVTGDSSDPTALAWRFSPVSNDKVGKIKPEEELRVLVATDVLSEGQNLQDCAIVVNYDLPWAIIRLIQRAGRVDRIGQQSETILCYSFLPAEGVERIIKLRSRVRTRLHENAEVVGTDELFFEDESRDTVLDIYNEKAGIFDGESDKEVDLASYAYQIWKNAITENPKLKGVIENLPSVVYSTKMHKPTQTEPDGALVYMRTAEDNDALAWISRDGVSVTESQYAILKAAECTPNTPGLPRRENHHELVRKGVEFLVEDEKSVGGSLGKPSGARYRAYERLKSYAKQIEGTLFHFQQESEGFLYERLIKAMEEIYRYPLQETAKDILNRQLRSGITDEALAQLVLGLRKEDRLCVVHEEERVREPRIICSMGLSAEGEIQ